MAEVLNFNGLTFQLLNSMKIVSCVKEMSAFSKVTKIFSQFSPINFEVLDFISGSAICLKLIFLNKV